MDSHFLECHRELVIMPIPTSSTEPVPPCLPDSDRFQVIFNVSCQHKYRNWILCRDCSELELLDEDESPLVIKSIQYNLEKATDSKFKMGRRVFKGLDEDFSLTSFERYELAKAASDTAWDVLVDSRLQGRRNSLHIDFNFAVVHKHIRVIQQSMQEVLEPVTSTGSSKSKIIDSSDEKNGSCRICLEDFGGGCEGVAMPCSHIFHKDCIEKWFKSASQCCPVCPHEMPTN